MAAFQSLNRSSRIVCMRVQWSHSDLSGCAPGVGCWLGGCWEIVGGVQLSKAELGLTLNSRSATLELSALRLSFTLGTCHTPTESCVVGHLFKSYAI
jgi:hypothetical protein